MATDTSAGVAYIDGEFVPIGEASVPILDLGFLRSDATYDVVAVWKGRFFRLDKHLDRFFAGLEKLRLDLPVDREGLMRVLADCVRRSAIDDAYVEVIATRGMPVAGSRDIRLCVNRMYCFAIPYVWIATPEQRERGIRLVVGETERISNRAVDPRIKNYHWLDFEQALLSAYDVGGDNVVLSDGKGLVTEGAGFNVFVVRDGVLQTPATNVLEGITRHTVLDIARELGIPCEAGEVAVDSLRTADEAFGASTAGGIFFVTSVDGTPLGDGRTGPLTQRIHDTYWAWHDDPRFTLAVSDVPPFEG
jgi:branched-chain amino acid aminotransferase